MHKGVIILTKAEDKDEAQNNVENFLEGYGEGNVWDWYVIGGRWSGTLNQMTLKFYQKAEELFKEIYPENKSDYVSVEMVKEQKDALQIIWEELGGTSVNPYHRNQYFDKGDMDDVLPLKECIDVVERWKKDMYAFAEECFQKIVEEREKEKGVNKWGMSGYYAQLYSNAINDCFSFDSNVFDIENETNDPTTALNEIEGWYAVIVDMHN